MRLRASLIVNATAGAGKAVAAAGAAARVLVDGGIEAVILVPGSTAAATSASKEAVAAGVDIVIACGGDGTIHTVLQAVAETPTLFGVIPTGTGDDNARSLKIPLGNPIAAARIILELVDAPRLIDLAKVSLADGQSRWYLGVLSTGFDSAVNERANAMRWPRGKSRYLLGMIGELRTFSPVPYQVVIDDVWYEGTAMLLSIGNGSSYGGGMRICPNALLDDGQADVTWLHEVSKRTFLRVFPAVYKGTHADHPSVELLRGKSIEVRAEGRVAYADGERLGPLPIKVQVVPGALRVLAP